MKGERFGQYIHNAYGKSAKVPAVSHDISFRRVDIFAAPWTSKYGLPYVDTDLEGKSFEFQHDFGCLNPSAAYKGCGTIESIESHYIYAKDNEHGRRLKFKLGACTRV